MKHDLNRMGLGVFMLVVLSASAHAACGGGGYTPAQPSKSMSKQDSRPADMRTTTEAVRTSAPAAQQATSRPVAANSAPKPTFDTNHFNSISGQLHLTYEQATQIVNAMNDIRSKLDDAYAHSKDFDPKHEFEQRLATILKPEQLKTYQSAS